MKLLQDCERRGINAWKASYSENMTRQFPKIRDAGCKIQFICLAASWHYGGSFPRTPKAILDGTIKCAEAAAEFKPIGIAFHGWAADLLHRAGKLDLIKTHVNRVYNLGISADISTHNPVILRALEVKGWSNKSYVASFHYLSRRAEEYEKEIGVRPFGETCLSSDPPRMREAV